MRPLKIRQKFPNPQETPFRALTITLGLTSYEFTSLSTPQPWLLASFRSKAQQWITPWKD